MYINKAIIYGNLTRDPEIKALPNGQNVCSFSVATNHKFTNKNGERDEQVEYHNVSCFGRIADSVGQYLKKSSGVFIEGRLQTRSWEKDGEKRYRTEIIAERVQFGPRRPSDKSTGTADTGNATEQPW